MTAILLQLVSDYGPLYHEYEADRLIKEPWNAFSSLVYLIPAFFWFFKLRGQFKDFPVLSLILPFLFLNGIGSTIYHATRSSVIFTLMDGLSAAIVIIITSVYLWKKITGKVIYGVVVVLLFYLISVLLSTSLSSQFGDMAINFSYVLSGSAFFIPALILEYRRSFDHWQYLLAALALLIIAITFRSLDYPTPNPFPEYIPQGTHFLWHIFSAMSAFPIGYYLYTLNEERQ